jgi:hypothetical protein
MRTKCDRCGVNSIQRKIHTVPVQFPDESVSYVQLCSGCLSFALKIVMEELLASEEALSQITEEKLSRKEVFNNILDHIKNKEV